MDNFDLASKWSMANMNYIHAMSEIMYEYCRQLNLKIKNDECCLVGGQVIVKQGKRQFNFYLDLDGMHFYKNGMGPYEISCEYSLPTVDEIIEECEFDRRE